MIRPNLYLKIAKYYDSGLVLPDDATDIHFYTTLINSGSKVLDIGCGTGRVALELARKNCMITGIDLSKPMLEVFREKLISYPDLDEKITLYNIDMRFFDLRDTFDWIIFANRTFHALIRDQDRRSCLSCVKRHLNRQGTAVISLFDTDPDALQAWVKSCNQVDLRIAPDYGEFVIERTQVDSSHDLAEQVLEFDYLYRVIHADGSQEEYPDRFLLGYMTQPQARDLFESSGFYIHAAYSDYHFRPFRTSIKHDQIYLLRVKAN